MSKLRSCTRESIFSSPDYTRTRWFPFDKIIKQEWKYSDCSFPDFYIPLNNLILNFINVISTYTAKIYVIRRDLVTRLYNHMQMRNRTRSIRPS